MSVAFMITPASTISRLPCNYPRNRVLSENIGILNNNKYVNHGRPFSRISFDIKNTGEYVKDTGLEQFKAVNIGGSDTSFG